MTLNIDILEEYSEIYQWIVATLSKRKSKKSKDEIIYLIEMVYSGFVERHFRISKNKFLRQASKKLFGKRLSEIYRGRDQIEIQYLNCFLFHEGFMNYVDDMRNEIRLMIAFENLKKDKKTEPFSALHMKERL